jgi:hypothetical protein
VMKTVLSEPQKNKEKYATIIVQKRYTCTGYSQFD